MKAALAILFSLFLHKAYNQDSLLYLVEKTDCYYLKQDESALTIYRKLADQYPDRYPVKVDKVLGDYFYSIGDTINAGKFYRHCISNENILTYCDSMNKREFQFKAAFALGKIYYKQTNYRKAISMLDTAMQKFRRSIWEYDSAQKVKHTFPRSYRFYWPDWRDSMQTKLEVAYSLSLCYDKLGLKDSVIYTLTPFMAQTHEPRVLKLYLTTLIERYGKEEAKKELQRGIESHIYEATYNSGYFYGHKCGGCYVLYIRSFIPFFSSTMELPVAVNGISVNSLGQIPTGETQEDLLNYFKCSPLYILLMEDNK